MAQTKRRDITEVVEHYLCHSCGSCFSSCGHDSISYKETTAGYIFPKIDYDSCTNCGLCFDVCPGEHFGQQLIKKIPTDPFIGQIQNSYVGISNNETIYKNSQSGGVTTEIVKYLLDENIVSAAIVTVMDEYSLETKATITTSSEEILMSQKSKYVPTSLTSLTPKLSKIEGKIAVVGLSCHMHGFQNLHKIDKKLNQRLIKIGLICEKVMLNSALDYFTQQITTQKIKQFNFKDPLYTKYPGDISLLTQNNERMFLDRKYRKTMKEFFTPIRCMLCFDKMNIYSDIVLGDPHGVEGINREYGENLVVTRTSLGEEIIQRMISKKRVNLRIITNNEALKGQGIDKKRKKFNANILAWKSLNQPSPEYPKEVFDSILEVTDTEIEKAKRQIEFSLNLDECSSRKEVLEKAKLFQNKKHSKKTIFTRIKNIFK